MDADVLLRRRALALDPASPAAARALDRELLRAGRRGEVEDRVRGKFRCSGRWIFTIERDDRYCWECDAPVVRVSSVREAIQTMRDGRGVALDRPSVGVVLSELVGHSDFDTAHEVASARVAPLTSEREILDTDWYWFLYKAHWGSEKAPLILSNLNRDRFEGEDRARFEEFLLSGKLPPPPPVSGPMAASVADYDRLYERGKRVGVQQLMHDALVHCRDRWSMDESFALSEQVNRDWENYNSLHAVAAMVLIAAVIAEVESLA